jgi:zinc protease
VNRRHAILTFLAAGAAAADDAIPKHPRELKYPPREFTPPKAAPYRHKLASGAVAFIVEDHQLPLIHLSVTFRGGSFLDPAGKAGLAQLTGSQMRAGGTRTKPPAQFDEEAAFLAAELGAGIGDVSGQASLNCLSKDLDAALALFADMLRNPGFAEDRLALAKSQSVQAMERRNDSTGAIESREFARLMRGGRHFSAAQPTRAGLESITRKDLADFHARVVYPANFVIAASGDFETGALKEKLDHVLAGWANGEAIPPVPAPAFTPKPGVYVVNKPEVNQGRVRMAHLGVRITNPDHVALGIMNGILGGDDFSSRITSRIRSDEGLAYSAGTSFTAGNYYEGLFVAAFQSKTPSVAQAAALVIEEIEKMRSGKVSREELAGAVSRAVESVPLRFATAAAKAQQFAGDHAIGLPEDYWERFLATARRLTPDDIQRVARQYLHPDQLVILAVGNAEAVLKGNPDRREYALEKLGKVERIPLPDPFTLVYPAGAP